jgi:hypothetical protein
MSFIIIPLRHTPNRGLDSRHPPGSPPPAPPPPRSAAKPRPRPPRGRSRPWRRSPSCSGRRAPAACVLQRRISWESVYSACLVGPNPSPPGLQRSGLTRDGRPEQYTVIGHTHPVAASAAVAANGMGASSPAVRALVASRRTTAAYPLCTVTSELEHGLSTLSALPVKPKTKDSLPDATPSAQTPKEAVRVSAKHTCRRRGISLRQLGVWCGGLCSRRSGPLQTMCEHAIATCVASCSVATLKQPTRRKGWAKGGKGDTPAAAACGPPRRRPRTPPCPHPRGWRGGRATRGAAAAPRRALRPAGR